MSVLMVHHAASGQRPRAVRYDCKEECTNQFAQNVKAPRDSTNPVTMRVCHSFNDCALRVAKVTFVECSMPQMR